MYCYSVQCIGCWVVLCSVQHRENTVQLYVCKLCISVSVNSVLCIYTVQFYVCILHTCPCTMYSSVHVQYTVMCVHTVHSFGCILYISVYVHCIVLCLYTALYYSLCVNFAVLCIYTVQ